VTCGIIEGDMTDIDEILARLNPSVREKVLKALDTTSDKQELPSIGLTRTLGGGIGYGRQTLLWGNRSSGKTLFALQTVSKAQQEGKGYAWIDGERNFDKDWAGRLGVDNDQLIVSQVTSISDVADAVSDMIRAGVDGVVIDSISALLPSSFFSDKDEMKPMENTGQIGQFSKDIGTLSKMINSINHKAALILISQVRTNLGGYVAMLKPMGGLTIDHMNSTSIKLWSNTSDVKQIKGEIRNGDYLYKAPIGRKVDWFVDKNRGPGMGMSGAYDLYYAGDFVGVDTYGELIDLGVELGKVQKKGTSWYTIYGEQLQGKTEASKYLRETPEIFEKLKGDILD